MEDTVLCRGGEEGPTLTNHSVKKGRGGKKKGRGFALYRSQASVPRRKKKKEDFFPHSRGEKFALDARREILGLSFSPKKERRGILSFGLLKREKDGHAYSRKMEGLPGERGKRREKEEGHRSTTRLARKKKDGVTAPRDFRTEVTSEFLRRKKEEGEKGKKGEESLASRYRSGGEKRRKFSNPYRSFWKRATQNEGKKNPSTKGEKEPAFSNPYVQREEETVSK